MGNWVKLKPQCEPVKEGPFVIQQIPPVKFILTDKEREYLRNQINGQGITVPDNFIEEVEAAMQSSAWDVWDQEKGKRSRANRKHQLMRFKKKTEEFKEMLKELNAFARHNFPDHDRELSSGEMESAALSVDTELMWLNTVLDSHITFYKPKNGRPPAISEKMAQDLKKVFESMDLPVNKGEVSFFSDVLRVCLESLGLPHHAPYRAIRNMK
ncbi:MAG: hypothetical protein ACLFNW_10685 [Desulfobacterales bacterium]